MNILYVITKTERGGAQQHVRDLAIGMRERGYNVTVAVGYSDGWLNDGLREQNIPVVSVRLRRSWNPFAFLGYMRDLYRLVKQSKPDVVHFHSSHTFVGAWVVRLFTRAKTIFTIHGLSILYPGAASKIKSFVYAWYLRSVLPFAHRVICVCQFDADFLLRAHMVQKKQCVVIHNGIDAPAFLSKQEARTKLGIPLSAVVVGTIARFSYAKHLELLIRAFSQLDQNVMLCLVGTGPEEQVLKKIVSDCGCADRVIFATGDARILKAFDVFALTSRYEGLPYSLLEAAFAQVPIVASDVGGVSELVQNQITGRVFPSGDLNACTQALMSAIHYPEISTAYANEEQEFMRKTCSKQDMNERTLIAYHDV